MRSNMAQTWVMAIHTSRARVISDPEIGTNTCGVSGSSATSWGRFMKWMRLRDLSLFTMVHLHLRTNGLLRGVTNGRKDLVFRKKSSVVVVNGVIYFVTQKEHMYSYFRFYLPLGYIEHTPKKHNVRDLHGLRLDYVIFI